MKALFLYLWILIFVLSACEAPGANQVNTKQDPVSIYTSEKVPGMKCECADIATNCQNVINRKYKCSNDTSNETTMPISKKPSNNEIIVSEPVP